MDLIIKETSKNGKTPYSLRTAISDKIIHRGSFMKHILFFIRYLIFFLYILLLLVCYDVRLAFLKIINMRSVGAGERWLNTQLGSNARGLLGITGVIMGLYPKYFNRAADIKLPQDQQFLIISNHQSILDILVISALFEEYPIRFILKKSLSKGFPYVSKVIRTQKHGAIDRKNPKQSIDEIKALAQRTKQHLYPIAVFPEGTRSRHGKVQEFKSAGVKTLLRKNPMPMVIVALHNGHLLPTLFSFRPFKRNRLFTKIIHVYPSVTMGECEQVLQKAREMIQSTIDQWDRDVKDKK